MWSLGGKSDNLNRVKQAIEAVAQGQATVIDVRTPEEFATGHALGAINWDLARMSRGEIPDIPDDTRIYLYCRSGGRSRVAKKILEGAGYRQVVNLGGISDWRAAGGEVEK
ncbi:rhodanese-like domain-containing protein [Candidatus Saccharibacteria bacterium]|nr:rhodanese-like domain-containing protein [Candidatus Saccharibacteria bacterium]